MTLISVPAGADRFRAHRPQARAGRGDWFRIQAKAASSDAEVWIFDEIGYWGTTAADFCQQFAAIDADRITLHLNTPGGDVFDGIAIANAVRDHPATVTVQVDALAASIGSVIAMAGDRAVMNAQSQMMIHDAWGFCMGNAADMTEMAGLLDRISNNIAGAYAGRAGGTAEMWRTAMRAESWYDAQEAVDAGLADEVLPQKDAEAAKAAARFDLTVVGARRLAARAVRPRGALVLSGQDTDFLRLMVHGLDCCEEACDEFLELPAEQRNTRVTDLATRLQAAMKADVDEATALLTEAGLPVEPDEMDMSIAGHPGARSAGGGGSDGGPRSGRTSNGRNGTTTTPSARQQLDSDELRIRSIL